MNMRLAPHPPGAGAPVFSVPDQTEVGDANPNLCHPAYTIGPTIAETTNVRRIAHTTAANA